MSQERASNPDLLRFAPLSTLRLHAPCSWTGRNVLKSIRIKEGEGNLSLKVFEVRLPSTCAPKGFRLVAREALGQDLTVGIWIKAIHVIAVIAWMAGMLYLPRLFVYHADAPPGSAMSETFKVMERRLLKAIVNPSMVAVFLSGLILAYVTGYWQSSWLHAKFILVLGLAALHGYFTRTVRMFARDSNRQSARFFRILNEIPTVLMVLIVLLVVLKPF
jgi:protoporphyrinogen IX oxidase